MRYILILLVLAGWCAGATYRQLDSYVASGVVRNSVAFNEDTFTTVSANTARTKTVCVTTKIDLDTDSATAMDILATDGDYVITTNNGEVYTVTNADWEADKVNSYTQITKPSTTYAIRSLWVLSPGVWLAGCSASGENDPAHIFKTTNYGQTWTDKFTFVNGYPNNWTGWDSYGDYVVTGEYGTAKTATNTGKGRIYYSDDAGETWTEIYDPIATEGEPTEPEKGVHCHFVQFAKDDPTTIYVGYGDLSSESTYGDQNRFFKLVKNGESWDYTLIRPYSENPTTALQDGDYIYRGQDAGYEVSLQRYNTLTGTHEDLLERRFERTSGTGDPYRQFNGTVNSFGLKKLGDIYYCFFGGLEPHNYSSIAVSIDGEHWAYALRLAFTGVTNAGRCGMRYLGGMVGGYIWYSFRDADQSIHIGRFRPPKVKNTTATLLEQASTNIFSADRSSSESAAAWSVTGDGEDAASSIRVTAASKSIPSLHGSYVYTLATDTTATGQYITAYNTNTTQPSNGDYIVYSGWVYAKSTTSRYVNFRLKFADTPSTILDNDFYSYIVPTNQWRKGVTWSKRVSADAMTVYSVQGIMGRYGGNGSTNDPYTMSGEEWDAAELYIDGMKLTYSTTEYDRTSFQVGGTPRAAEKSVVTVAGTIGDFALSWQWSPVMNNAEYFRDVHLIGISDGTNAINVYYDQSEGDIIATDGTNKCTLTDFTWEENDFIKFSLSCRRGYMVLATESDYQDMVAASVNGCVITAPTEITFNTSYDGSATYANGYVTDVRLWNEPLGVFYSDDLFRDGRIVTGSSSGGIFGGSGIFGN